MKKKYIIGLSSLIAISSLNSTSIFANNQNTKFTNTATLTLDTENNEYTLEKDGKLERGSLTTSAVIGIDNFYNIATFTSIDTGKLTVTSASTNSGKLHVKAVKSKDNTVHYSTGSLNLSPGGKWTTAGGLSGLGTKYTIIAKASEKGTYTLSLKW